MRNKKTLYTVIISAVICVALLGVLWSQKTNIRNLFSDKDVVSNQGEVKEAAASDEATLRELLKEDSNLEIHVDKDMEVKTGFEVNGTKKLTGDGELKMALDAEFEQGLLMVKEGASLIMDGLVLNGNYVADGIQMEENTTLEYLSGTIKLTDAFGIQANGKVTIKDVRIEEALHTGILADNGCELVMEGGMVSDSASYDMWVCKNATVEITGDAVLKDNYGSDVIRNYGTLNVTGGKFSAGNNTYIFRNHNKLNITGTKEHYVECTNSGYAVVCNRDGGETNISYLHVHDTSRHAVVMVNGKTTIKDSKFETTGTHAIEAQGGELIVENVTVKDSGNAGLEAKAGSVVTIKDFSVDGCKGIGIACRGANVTGENITLTNVARYGVTCGKQEKSDGVMKLTNITITKAEKASVYAYDNGTLELVDAKISDGNGRGIYTYKEGKVTMSGASLVKNMKNGGVRTDGTFTLNGGEICDNDTEQSGAGVYVGKGGSFIMNGGSIHGNDGGLRGGGICVTEGTVTINDGNVYKNSCADNGGGIYAQKTSVVTLKKGSITENVSAKEGNGICIVSKETKVTMYKDFYLGKNDVKVNNVETVFKIEGNTLTKHSASDPLLLTPNHDAKEGTVVATCNSTNVAKSIATMVGSGDGSYSILQNDKNFTIKYTTADMNMAGADTKYVSNFEELKTAILGTTGKRNIVLTGNIVVTERIRFNGGSTIKITDDGKVRTISRGSDYTGNFFVTHYGTGLYLEATKAGNLIVDGTYASTKDVAKVNSLVRASGSTVLRNVTLKNNGSLDKNTQIRGALFRQLYGDFKAYDCVFTGGQSRTGGAVMIDAGTGYIEGSTFTNNASIIGGGAVRTGANTTLKVVDSTFTNNTAGTSGGVIAVVEKADVTVEGSKFANNTATTYGGAIYIQDTDTTVIVEDTTFEANVSKGGGAIYLTAKANLDTKDCNFVNNTTKHGDTYYNGGAIETRGNYSDENSSFTGNTGKTGGAVAVMLGKAVFTGTDANASFTNNEVLGEQFSKGGAVYVNEGSAKITGYTFTGNKALAESDSMGGALGANADTRIDVENCIFDSNESKKGGAAIMVLADATVTTKNSEFKNNVSTTASGNGGAIRVDGTYEDTNSKFENNSGRNGGAIAVMSGSATLKGTDANALFKDNKATASSNARGAAIFVNTGNTLTVTGYQFDANTTGIGAVYGVDNSQITLTDATFVNSQEVQIRGTLTFGNVTGVVIKQLKKDAVLVLANYQAGNEIVIAPSSYTVGNQVLTKAETMDTVDFVNACAGANRITLNDADWSLSAEGKLVSDTPAVMIGEQVFYSCDEAVAYANENGKTGEEADVVLTVLKDVEVSATLEISKNIAIQNAAGKEIRIKRNVVNDNSVYMFKVAKDGKLTLGSNEKDATGKLIIDGQADNSKNGRNINIASGGTLILGKNASIENAKAWARGVAFVNAGTAKLYGTIQNTSNESTGESTQGGAILNQKGATLIIEEGTYTKNVSNIGSGGFIYAVNGSTITINGGTFTENQAKNGGGVIYTNGVLNATNATFANNKANGSLGGGAIYVDAKGVVTLKNSAFTENQCPGGGAGGAIVVYEGAQVSTNNCTFTKNDATKSGNGGAVYCNGTYNDEDSIFTDNYGRNGGAIIVQGKGTAILDAKKGKGTFNNNTAYANGNALFVNTGGKMTITGYKFEGAAKQTIQAKGTINYKSLTGNYEFVGSGAKEMH